jgi:hypothetical protein
MVDSDCSVDNSVVFSDGAVKLHDVSQQAWARSLTRCDEYVEILNTSLQHVTNTNQVAWKEEITIRLNGRLNTFDSALEKGGWFSKLLYGSLYAWKRPPVDPNKDNLPQAVIADGESLANVDGSLLYLSSQCKLAGIPLFVVNDPRLNWYDNSSNSTNDDVNVSEDDELIKASRNMSTKIKSMIVQRAMKIKQGDAFNAGKEYGIKKAEANANFQRERDNKRYERVLRGVEGESYKVVPSDVLVGELGRRGIQLCDECSRRPHVGEVGNGGSNINQSGGEESTGEQ